MGAMASQITSLIIVYSAVYSGLYQRKHQTPRHWPLCGNSPHKWPVTRKMFPFDDVIMTASTRKVANRLWSNGARIDADIQYNYSFYHHNSYSNYTSFDNYSTVISSARTNKCQTDACISAVGPTRYEHSQYSLIYYAMIRHQLLICYCSESISAGAHFTFDIGCVLS